MVLCHVRKMDQNNRILIPKEFIKMAGGHENGDVYVMFDEDSKEIKIKCKDNAGGSQTEENAV